ncbi:MAG: POTRA domain-containing protein [Ignavibacteriaceae bacterium]
MRRSIKNILFILFLLSSAFNSQTIQTINISGNNIFDDQEILSWMEISSGMQYYNDILDSLKNRVALNLGYRGYFKSSFENSNVEFLNDSQQVKINLEVNEGEPTYINKIIFAEKDSLFENELELFLSDLKGNVFNKHLIEDNINEILTFLENKGYPFSKIIINSSFFYYDSTENINYVDLHLNLAKGLQSRIDKIEVVGNAATKDYVIIRELRLEKGEIYSQKTIDELPSKLNKLRFFDPVNVPKYFINSENEGVIVIEVKEKQTNNFDGIIGYIPPPKEGESGFLTGLVNVSLRNLFGTGRAAAIRWQQLNKNSQELELKYFEPWLFGYPFNLSGGLFQRKQDTTYVQRSLEGALEFLATQDISAALTIATESVIPTENDNFVFSVYNSTSLTTGINLKIDTRDDPYAPRQGLLFINSYSFSRKTINGPAQFITPDLETKINLQRISLSLTGFYEIFKRQVAALSLNGRELRGSFFEDSDLFRLGGTTTLRGYRENQFLGSRIFWTNLEYRFLLAQRSFAFIFFDTGYFLRSEDLKRNILKQEDFKYGYGLGLSLETGLGVLGVSFALGEGDSFTDGKIHFGLINEF